MVRDSEIRPWIEIAYKFVGPICLRVRVAKLKPTILFFHCGEIWQKGTMSGVCVDCVPLRAFQCFRCPTCKHTLRLTRRVTWYSFFYIMCFWTLLIYPHILPHGGKKNGVCMLSPTCMDQTNFIITSVIASMRISTSTNKVITEAWQIAIYLGPWFVLFWFSQTNFLRNIGTGWQFYILFPSIYISLAFNEASYMPLAWLQAEVVISVPMPIALAYHIFKDLIRPGLLS